jgi:hypothetical protein
LKSRRRMRDGYPKSRQGEYRRQPLHGNSGL